MDYNEAALVVMNRMSKVPHKDPLNKIQKFSKGELSAMDLLQNAKEPLSAGDIAYAMHTSSARVANLLKVLESKGYIERCIDTSDRRKILVAITKDGSKTIEKTKQEMQKHLVSVFKKMGEADTVEFLRLSELFFNLMHSQTKEEKEEASS